MDDLGTIIKEIELSGYECSVTSNARVWDKRLKFHTYSGFSITVTGPAKQATLHRVGDDYRVTIRSVGSFATVDRATEKTLEEAIEFLQRQLKR